MSVVLKCLAFLHFEEVLEFDRHIPCVHERLRPEKGSRCNLVAQRLDGFFENDAVKCAIAANHLGSAIAA